MSRIPLSAGFKAKARNREPLGFFIDIGRGSRPVRAVGGPLDLGDQMLRFRCELPIIQLREDYLPLASVHLLVNASGLLWLCW